MAETIVTARLWTCHYLGGFPNIPKKKTGSLSATAEDLYLGNVRMRMRDITSVEVTAEASTIDGDCIFGFGPAKTKQRTSVTVRLRTRQRTAVSIHLRSGEVGYFVVEKKTPPEVRGKLAPALRAAGVPFHDQLPAPASAPSTADELAKLAQLRGQGVLTDDEFATQKARLLG